MRLSRLALLPVLLIGSGSALAAPGDAIGSAVAVVSLVMAELESDQRLLAVGDGVRQQELITVDAQGRSELELRDKTKLALGPGSSLLLDKFIYDPDISGGAIVLNLVQGSFRFITGLAAKPAYVIHTPTASITVRGTIFDVYVKEDRTAWLLLLEGAGEVCTSSGKCLVHDEPGKLIRILPDTVGAPVKWAGLPGKQDSAFDTAFPFVTHAPKIDPSPIFTRDEIVLGTFPEKPHSGDDEPEYKEDGNKGDAKKRDDGDKADEGKYRPKAKKHNKGTREAQRYRRPRREASDDSSADPGFNIMLGIGGRLGGRGNHNHGSGYSPK